MHVRGHTSILAVNLQDSPTFSGLASIFSLRRQMESASILRFLTACMLQGTHDTSTLIPSKRLVWFRLNTVMIRTLTLHTFVILQWSDLGTFMKCGLDG